MENPFSAIYSDASLAKIVRLPLDVKPDCFSFLSSEAYICTVDIPFFLSIIPDRYDRKRFMIFLESIVGKKNNVLKIIVGSYRLNDSFYQFPYFGRRKYLYWFNFFWGGRFLTFPHRKKLKNEIVTLATENGYYYSQTIFDHRYIMVEIPPDIPFSPRNFVEQIVDLHREYRFVYPVLMSFVHPLSCTEEGLVLVIDDVRKDYLLDHNFRFFMVRHDISRDRNRLFFLLSLKSSKYADYRFIFYMTENDMERFFNEKVEQIKEEFFGHRLLKAEKIGNFKYNFFLETD